MSIMKTGVLLVNLGTPEAPDTKAINRYLSEFLLDKRVIDLSRWLWLPLLKGIILPRRVPKVAKLYQAIWTEQGSPLLAYSRQQQQGLNKCLSSEIEVELAMTYGSPSVKQGVDNLLAQGVTQLIVLPLFPQYSSTTTAAVWDALNAAFAQRRNLPEVIFIRDYATHPLYIEALVESIQTSFADHGRPDLLVFSYHGLPERYVQEGDDYALRCQQTTAAVVEQLGLTESQYKMVYQSRFGKEEWLKPYADHTLQQIVIDGVKHVQVICPGFAADCLETLEEVAVTNKALFLEAGGQQYHYIPALNAQPRHIKLLQQLVLNYLNKS